MLMHPFYLLGNFLENDFLKNKNGHVQIIDRRGGGAQKS